MTANDGERSAFGAALRRLRLRAGLSQPQLAELARMSVEGVGALERGTRRAPYRETVDLLAGALNATPEERDELHAAARRPRRLPTPTRTAATAPNNLPPEATRLVGRDRALGDVRALLHERIVTICGSGGIGKTRLAVGVCRALLADGAADNVWFVPLEALASDELVAPTVARTLGTALGTDDVAAEHAIVAALGGRRGVLLIDNCEHVVDGVTAVVRAISASCPGICILATSRRPLSVPGEVVFRLESLAVPSAENFITAAEALRFGAVALFVDRASAASAGFTFSDAQVAPVVEICTRLDGIPLAIELAAARTKVLSVQGVAKHLSDRFRLLTAGSADAMPRQRTLSALIDWSYDLLSPTERVFLNRTAVCAGGFDLDAARAICADSVDMYEVLDVIGSLVDQSLIVAETERSPERYRLLESTRDYAIDRLDADGESAAASRRHAEHFAAIARAADATWGTLKATPWLAAIEPDTDNFRHAIDWALGAGGDVALAAGLVGPLERFWLNGGLEIEGRRRVAQVLELLDEAAHPALAARLWRARAWLTMSNTKFEAATRACELYAQIGDDTGSADALRQLALACMQMGRIDEGEAANAQALDLFRAIGDRRGVANCLDMAGALARTQGRTAQARRWYDDALEAFRALGNDGGIASVLVGLSDVEASDGNVPRAIALVEDARAIHQLGKYTTNLALDAMLLCIYRTLTGDLPRAHEELRAALELGRAAGNAAVLAASLFSGASIFALAGDPTRGAGLMGYAQRARERVHLPLDESERRLLRIYEDAVERSISGSTRSELEAQGALWSEERAIDAALAPLGDPTAVSRAPA